MFRFGKGDIFPLFLALISTVLAVSLCYFLLSRFDFSKLERKSKSVAKQSNTEAETNSGSIIPRKPQNIDRPNQPTASESDDLIDVPTFAMPDLVPQGTAIAINGSPEIDRVNHSLRKGFHRKFPGTAVNTEAHGEEMAMKLLRSGNIDLAAIERSLTEEEISAGLKAIRISNSIVNGDNISSVWHYVYRSPVDPGVEAFLGYVLSPEGQLIIGDRVEIE